MMYIHATERELDELVEYVEEIHSSLKRSHDSLHTNVRKEMEGKSEEKRDEIAEWYAEDDIKLGDMFPAMCSAATFVTIYSYFEHALMSLCTKLQKRRKYKIGVNDLSGRGYIDQAANYLEKICDLDEPKKLPEWLEITNLQKVRNIVAHERGVLKKPNGKGDAHQHIRKYVQSQASLKINGMNELVLTQEFCLHAISVVRAFLIALLEKLPDLDVHPERIRD